MTPPEGVLPLVDTHVHLWDRRRSGLAYGWLDAGRHPVLGDLAGLDVDRYSVPELRADARLHGVTAVVHAAAATGPDPVAETAWLQGLGDATGWPDALVAACDLAAPDAAAVLERHRAHGRFRGVRDDRPPAALADPALRRGLALLSGTGEVFCHPVGVEGVAEGVALARALPDVTLVVDQAGLPLQRDAAYREAWSAALRALAAEPNTVVKISSLGLFEHGWTPASRRPWVLACVEAFGPDRCMVGTNWPVERLWSGYGDVVGALRAAVAELTVDEQRAVLAGTAGRVLRL
ncbi:amidohydrolase family protein [Cellulomonas endophytica]|uniref:amidohydrolase family protein n=1 Tax=Cellulomonas endophytica TaxID=2494735 RepID=UPI0013E951C6|nr:amidohydrolase family protein [Cellulomonas endophytica]